MLTNRFSLIFSPLLRRLLKMTEPVSWVALQDKATAIQNTIVEVQKELDVVTQTYNDAFCDHLRDENRRLKEMIENARMKLIIAEKKNGVPQIAVPKRNVACSNETQKVEEKKDKGDVPKKEKKAPKETKPKLPVAPELPVDVGRLDLRIAKIEDVQKHPDADTLYVLKINCGEDKPRTVCSGLVEQIPKEDLENRFVVLLCNLKPQKMRGITSEAMVMCACSSDAVEVLMPPENSQIGDLVYCEGYERNPDAVMNPKKKIFEAVAPDLRTNDKLEACYKGVVFNVPGKGNIVAKTLKNVPVK
ncbi:aminoacyl tRNA synthase complex-interacting multifunctional protein 1 [Onthophagus taurus]|uniref:aminoacyl tRNA synthase complex-interacting multifunctional protein 1 n=1 Tax=Onthophagus taurus TaxID=166361 RepID=UPI0039BEB03E